MSKFQVGDRVCLAKPEDDFYGETGIDPEVFMDRVLVVERIDDSDCPVFIESVWFKTEELEFEHIHNSPLMKALRQCGTSFFRSMKEISSHIIMRLMKFKKGDRVVVAKLIPASTKEKTLEIGMSFEIVEVFRIGKWPYKLDNAEWLYTDEELEHDHIYNSPLYKALL